MVSPLLAWGALAGRRWTPRGDTGDPEIWGRETRTPASQSGDHCSANQEAKNVTKRQPSGVVAGAQGDPFLSVLYMYFNSNIRVINIHRKRGIRGVAFTMFSKYRALKYRNSFKKSGIKVHPCGNHTQPPTPSTCVV